MQPIEHMDELPRPLYVIANSFVNAETYNPEIWECTPDEVKERMQFDDMVFQIVLDREYHRFYAVAMGDSERQYQSQLIIHNPTHVQQSSLYFAEVDGDWIAAERNLYDQQIYNEPIEFDYDEDAFRTPFQHGG